MKLKLLQDQNDEMHSCATMCILSKCHHFQDLKVSEDSCQDLNRRCVCVNYPDNLILNVLIHSKFMVGGDWKSTHPFFKLLPNPKQLLFTDCCCSCSFCKSNSACLCNFLAYIVLDYPEVSVIFQKYYTKVIQGIVILNIFILGVRKKRGSKNSFRVFHEDCDY